MNGARTAQTPARALVHGVMRWAVAVIGSFLVALLVGGCADLPVAPGPARRPTPSPWTPLRARRDRSRSSPARSCSQQAEIDRMRSLLARG